MINISKPKLSQHPINIIKGFIIFLVVVFVSCHNSSKKYADEISRTVHDKLKNSYFKQGQNINVNKDTLNINLVSSDSVLNGEELMLISQYLLYSIRDKAYSYKGIHFHITSMRYKQDNADIPILNSQIKEDIIPLEKNKTLVEFTEHIIDSIPALELEKLNYWLSYLHTHSADKRFNTSFINLAWNFGLYCDGDLSQKESAVTFIILKDFFAKSGSHYTTIYCDFFIKYYNANSKHNVPIDTSVADTWMAKHMPPPFRIN